jgi:integrase
MSINDFLYIPIYIAVKTGLRRSEILSLRWKDIDLNKNTISVTEGKSRNSVRTLEIPSSLSEALTERKIFQNFSLQVNDIEQTDDTLVVCRTNGKPYNPTYISRRFTEFVEVNNLPPVRFHDLRHYFAVSAHNNGVPIKTLSLALGHTSAAATVDNYVNIEYDDFIPIS